MARLDEASGTARALDQTDGVDLRGDGWFDVAVVIENELTGTAARRLSELYQIKNAPLRFHLVRPLGNAPARTGGSRQHAERLMQKSVERMEALQMTVTGVVSDQDPSNALSNTITRTHSQEVVVVTGRHRLATLLHRDLASQLRTRTNLPLVHLVER